MSKQQSKCIGFVRRLKRERERESETKNSLNITIAIEHSSQP